MQSRDITTDYIPSYNTANNYYPVYEYRKNL
jgi:hypothetical protein